MKMRSILFVALCALCFACGNMRTFQIETYEPADVTYPAEVKKLLMVNNAVPQPDSVGYHYTFRGELQDTCRAEADSALVAFCRSLGMAIVDASYFEDVLLYHDAVRTDKNYLTDKKLTPEQVRTLCDENGTEAVLSLDRLTFSMERSVESIPSMGAEYGVVKVRASGLLRTYVPAKAQPLGTILLADSVIWEEMAANIFQLNELLPQPDDALTIAAAYIGAKMSPHFVPHWSEASRWFYTSPGARWKEASAFAAAGKWKEAEERWQAIAQNTTRKSDLAEVYTNLALACEMQNRFPEAYDWARKAQALFDEEDAEGKDALLLRAYVQVLGDRINADKKLNIQIGE